MRTVSPRRNATLVTLSAVLLALLACKKSSDPSPSPSAELPSGGSPTPVEPQTPTPAETTVEPTPAPANPGAPAPVAAKPTATATTTATASGSAAPTATTPPAPTGPSKACVDKCQGIMQICLTPKATDGGFPQMADPAKCQQAFADCQTACK
jgi:hypothetical protein